jgi:chemotaxis protein MotB
MDRRSAIIAALILAAGVVFGFLIRPVLRTDPRIGELEEALAASETAKTTEKDHAAKLQKELDQVTAAKASADKALKFAEDQLADQQKSAADKTKELEGLRDKVKAASDKAIGAPVIEGDTIRVSIGTGLLFKGTEDQLTDRGKQVLTKLAGALKEMNDRNVMVVGHTDDTQPPQPRVVKAPPPPPPKKGQKPAPVQPAAAPVSRFPTNWELAGLRAIAVVHHLQDVAKLDPKRLAAQSFGQYQPASRTNKGLNRRVDIIIAPKPTR